MRERMGAWGTVAIVVCLSGAWFAGRAPSPAGAAPAPGPVDAAATAKRAKLSPRLSVLARDAPRHGFVRASALSLPDAGVGSLVRRANGDVLVEIRTADVGAPTLDALQAAGANIVNVSSQYSTVTASVAPNALAAIAAGPAVRYVNEVLAPRVAALDPAAVPPAMRAALTASPTCGSATSEADVAMNVAAARASFNVDGTGQTVGILSDSFNSASGAFTTAQQDVASGDLPGPGNPCGYTTPVLIQSDASGSGQSDEGRAMAQLVHDLAPGARLAFATAFNGEVDFASQITRLRTVNHATVIVDDASYLDEPFFQNGPIAVAANQAAAAGVPYFSAAGNDNVIVGGNDVSSYESPSYRPTSCPHSVLVAEPLESCHNFNPSGSADSGDTITVAPNGGFGLDLQWNQPWGGVTTDLDAFVVNSSGSIVAASTINNDSSQTPFEYADYENTTGVPQQVQIVIGKYSGAANPRLKFILTGASGILAVEHDVSTGTDIVGPTIFGHTGAQLVGSTAAIAYDANEAPEDYSSRGPVTHYFNDVPSTAPLATPLRIDKPDFTATDGVQTTFFAQLDDQNVWRFYGTSAAAPEAAAVGALLKQYDPALSASAVLATLRDTATPLPGDTDPDTTGGGYIDALTALAEPLPLPGAPGSVGASTGNQQAEVQWSAPATNPGYPVTGYVITPFLGGVPQTPETLNSTATNGVVTGLANGKTYTFKVAAVNDNGQGPTSNPSPGVTIGAPANPTGVVATAGNAAATLRWAPPAVTNGSPVTKYVVTPYLGAVAKPAHVFGATTSGVMTGLANASTYTFKVAATNGNGTGAQSPASGALTIGAPTPPTLPHAGAGNGAASVVWGAPASTNGAPVLHYVVVPYRAGFPQAMRTFPASPRAQVLTGLTNGATYMFRIAAVNSRGTGVSIATGSVLVGGPLAPASVHATVAVGQVTVSWAAAGNNGAPITGYIVFAYVGAVEKSSALLPPNALKEIDNGLVHGTTYSFRVAATNARGVGPISSPSNLVTP